MRFIAIVLVLAIAGSFAARASGIRLLLVAPGPGEAAGASFLVRGIPHLALVDNLNSVCLRENGASTPRCRSSLLAEARRTGIARLPYLAALDQQANLPPEVEH